MAGVKGSAPPCRGGSRLFVDTREDAASSAESPCLRLSMQGYGLAPNAEVLPLNLNSAVGQVLF